MKRNIVIMDFSGIYQNEQFYEGEQISWIDLSDISGTNCYCDGDAQAQILERMEKYPVSGIYFMDSGNYHYMSRIGTGRVKEPFNLLVFDKHAASCFRRAFVLRGLDCKYIGRGRKASGGLADWAG